jgi:hypothetical protein
MKYLEEALKVMLEDENILKKCAKLPDDGRLPRRHYRM